MAFISGVNNKKIVKFTGIGKIMVPPDNAEEGREGHLKVEKF